jgi:hypothetical protein
MIGEAEGNVIDRLATAIDRTAMARNEVYDRLAIGVEPIAGESEGGPIARLQPQYGFEKSPCAFQIVRAQRDAVEHGLLTRWLRRRRRAAVEPLAKRERSVPSCKSLWWLPR